MKYFVTGASGFIGERLCRKLASDGHDVVALCRKPGKVNFSDSSILVRQGDVCEPSTLAAMDGADFCFHLASLAAQWARDSNDFYRVNVTGTKNVLEAAQAYGVKKLVFTSTAGVFGPSPDADLLDENSGGLIELKSDYEKSKKQAECEVKEFSARTGLDCCIVNPTRVFGPGQLSESNALTRIIGMYCRGGLRFVPAVRDFQGNYVFVDDVVNGHLLAMKYGGGSENYILGGENISLLGLFQLVAREAEHRGLKVSVPLFMIRAFAKLQDVLSSAFGVRPIITSKFVNKYASHNPFSVELAREKLGYDPINLEEGIRATVNWYRNS